MHRANLEKAKSLLVTAGHTLVLCNEQIVITDKRRGIRPLLDLVEGKLDGCDFSAADKVVGKAAAFLYRLMGIRALYAQVVSEPAAQVLQEGGIVLEYGTLVPAIRNRTNTGFCPMESAVWNITDPQEALSVLRKALES
jgi:hypothetical protein